MCINDFMQTHSSHHLVIETALSEYLSLNDVSALTLWEAHKAVILGRLIQIATVLKRERKIMFTKLEAALMRVS